jgi:short-subunit dehydrogenase
MVALSDVRSSNDRIASSLPAGLVAVFVGGTGGIGETSLKQFVKHARQPRVYIVGRSEEAGKRTVSECQSLNKEGEYNFISADVSLIRAVDDVCRDITSKEPVINLLFQSQGTLTFGTGTSATPLGEIMSPQKVAEYAV